MSSYNSFSHDFYEGFFGGFEGAGPMGAMFGILLGTFLMAFIIIAIVLVVSYVFFGIALYKIAQRRNIENPWLAWVPIANYYLLGQVVDQIFVYKGKKPFFAPVLLALVSANMFMSLLTGFIGIFGILAVPVSLALTVLIYWAYYEIFSDYTPKNATMFLVLSILFSIPWVFLFVIRDRQSISMGGQSDAPPTNNYYQPQQPQQPQQQPVGWQAPQAQQPMAQQTPNPLIQPEVPPQAQPQTPMAEEQAEHISEQTPEE